MKRAMALALAMVLAAGTQLLAAQAAFHKYDVKSGIITMDSVMKMGTFEMKTKEVVYFDDFGMKECKETYQDGALSTTTFSDGKFIYSLKPNKKTAFKTGEAYRGTELRVDFSEMGSQKDRDSGKVKKVAPMKIAGKDCEMIEANLGTSLTQYGGWKKVLVYMKTSSSGMTTTIKANKIEENVAVPAAKFKVPAGYKVQ
jgi:outer membrane lipoprotein-sorting protein